METSSDTIYHYLPDANTTIPLIVRTPSIHSMDPPEVFLIPTVFTDRYYFMSLLKAEFNFETGRGFPISGLMYDRLENSLFIPKIYNGDYTSKREVDMMSRPLDPEFVIGQSLQAHELAEAYGKGRLKGKLKEIATTLDEESNPVIMLINIRKINTSMKVNLISVVLLFALAGCGKDKQSTDELVTINVSKDYPEKELILQDIMDVEYIALETTDEFITHGNVMDVDEKIL